MGDHLKVDLDQLRSTGTRLRTLSREFSRSSRFSDASTSVIGHARVCDALDEFASNWKRHREKLTEHLDAVAQMATDSAETYQKTDEELAAALDDKGAR